MLTVTPDPEWQRQAACLGMDPDLFFPPSGDPAVRAKAACARCPVTAECLQAAIDERDEHSVRGGYTATERLKFRTRRRKPCRTCGRIYSPHETGRQVYCSEGCAAIGRDRLPSRNGTAA